MPGELLLGIDIGTYESKGVLADSHGKVIAHAAVPHQLSLPNPGWVEHDADGVWWHDFVLLCRGLLSEPGVDPAQVACVGVSSIAPCVLPVDKEGRPLRPAILYGIDTRANHEMAALEDELGVETIFASNGLRLTSHAAGPKILWIRSHEPDVWAKTSKVLTGSGYLVYRLTGEYVIDIYTAFAYAPLFDIKRNEWNRAIAERVTPVDRLPRLAWSVDQVGRVTPGAARETGLLAGTPVIAGTSDAASEALSAGLSAPGDMMLMYGSSQFFLQKTRDLVSSHVFWGHAFLEPGSYAFTAGMSTSGSVTRWFRDNFAQQEQTLEKAEGKNAYESLAALAAESPPGARGLVLLPYFSGERSPLNDPEACGLVIGLTLRHTRADLYRAILEGIGYGIRHNVETMWNEGIVPDRMLAVGGGTKNPLWLQIVSDIAGIEQYVPDQAYGAAYGDAFLAGVGIGLFADTTQMTTWVGYQKVVRPDPNAHSLYEDYYPIYKSLYRDNSETMHRLSALAQRV